MSATSLGFGQLFRSFDSCDFVTPLGLKQPTVSYHLRQLTDAGLLQREKRGSYAYFQLAPSALGRLGDLVAPPPPFTAAV